MKGLFLIILYLITLSVYSQESKVLENYLDSITGMSGEKYYIKLSRIQPNNSKNHLVKIIFSTDMENKSIIDHFDIEKDLYLGCDPLVYDYNGDGNLDYSFVSNMAARGANEVRSLFVFNPETGRFSYIKNSEDYPNIIYNASLNCLDSWAFHGGTTQFFLLIKGNELIPTYSIDVHGTERVLSKYINGQREELKIDTLKEEGFYRYRTFNPYLEYTFN